MLRLNAVPPTPGHTPASGLAKLAPVFFGHAVRLGAKPAICYADITLGYDQLARQVCHWSHVLAAHGVERGQHIAVLLPNSIEFVTLILAAADLGVVLVPLNPALTPVDVCRAFDAADVEHVVATGALWRALLEPLAARPGLAPGLWLSVDEPVHGSAAVRIPLVLADLLLCVAADARPIDTAHENDALILTMTSGSTGAPKPIILTQRTKFNRVQAAVELYGITEADRVLAATPLYHSLAERLVLIPLLTGGTSVLMSGFSAKAWLNCVRKSAVTFSIAVSSQLKQIADTLSAAGNVGDITTLRCIVSSSALLHEQTRATLVALLACEFHECYGASEIAIASNLSSRSTAKKLKSVGLAAPGVDIKILGSDDAELGPGEAGEIVCRTPMLFGGYFKRPDLTRLAMWGDYFRTGDTGKLDGDGFLYFLGRSKDIIISGGINVYPADIEAIANQYPGVQESAAFAHPDDRLGEIVALALVVAGDHFDLRHFRFFCADRLADFQQPRKFFRVAELPKNMMGKLMKFQLAKQLISAPTGFATG